MAIFEIRKIEQIRARSDCYYLLKNGKNLYAEAEEKIRRDGGYDSELISVQVILEMVANGEKLPVKKYRMLQSGLFEIKTRNLRAYLFHETRTGKILVMLGKKNSQKKDIPKFKSIVEQYFNS